MCVTNDACKKEVSVKGRNGPKCSSSTHSNSGSYHFFHSWALKAAGTEAKDGKRQWEEEEGEGCGGGVE